MFKKKKEVLKKAVVSVKSGAGKVTDEIMKEITHLAYKYWEQRGYQHGQELNDWLRAEKEINRQAV